MSQPLFTPIGSFPVRGVSDIPVNIEFPTLKVEFEGNFDLSNWLPIGRLYRMVALDGEPPTIAENRVLFLQQPTLIIWSGLDLPYSLKFEPAKFFGDTPLTISLAGSYSRPSGGSGEGGNFTIEEIQDLIGSMFAASGGIQSSYNDALGQVLLQAIFGAAENTICQGNDPRLSDPRPPTPGSVTNSSIANDAGIAWTKISKQGANPGDIGAVGPIHSHPADAIAGLIEAVQDIVASLIQAGENMNKVYDDDQGVLLLSADSGGSQVQTWSDLILNSSAWESIVS